MTFVPTIAYVMKAKLNFPPYQKITWRVYNTPDTTGAQSGYDPATLIDIVVDYTINLNQATENGATPVLITPGGPAGGDLGGTYPNPDVLKVHGYAVSATAPTNQQVLIWNSTTNQYEPGAQLSGPPSGAAGGDLSGTYPNPTVINIHGTSVPATPSANQVLRATNGTTATWTTLDNNSISSSAGIVYSKLNLTGGIVNADVNASAAIAGSKITPNFGTQTLTAGQSILGTSTAVNSLTGSITFTSRSLSSSDTIDSSTTDVIIYADTSGGAFSINLPTPTAGRLIIIKDKKQTFASNNLTIVRHGSEKIDGVAASLVLNVNNQEVFFESDGTDWYTNVFSTSPTGPAGGDLSGTYPNPTVANGAITNAKVNASAAIAYSKLNLSNSIVNTDINSSAAIAYSKLNLTNSIVNADINSAAAIAGTKISPNFGSQAVTTSNSGQFGLINTTSNQNVNQFLGGQAFTIKTFSATGNIDTTTTDTIIFADTSGGAFTLTLPDPTALIGVSRLFFIKDKKQTFATNNLTIARHSTEKIDGVAANLVLSISNQEVIMVSDGTDWYTQGTAGASGAAGGDLTGTYPNPTVAKLRGNTVKAGSLGAGDDGKVLTWVNANSDWEALTNNAAVTWANDLATSTNTSQNVVSLTGSSSVVSMKARDFIWTSGIASPSIQQTSTSGAGTRLLIRSQVSTGSTGGDLDLQAGDALSTSTGGKILLTSGAATVAGSTITINGASTSTYGSISLTSGGSTLSFSDAGAFNYNRFGTGVLHSSSIGDISSSLIVNADISSSAAIGYSKLNLSNSIVNSDIAAGANIAYSKLFLTNDIVNSDIANNAAIQVTKLSSGAAGQILVNDITPTPQWQTMNGDVTINNGAATTINSITGGSPITIIPPEFQWNANAVSDPLLDIASKGSTSSGSGANGLNFKIVPQAGQAATGASHNGGNGGNLNLSSGAGGTSGSATPGTAGNVSLQLGGTELIKLDGSTIGNVTFSNAAAVPNFTQTAAANTNTPAAGANWTIKSQTGTSAVSGNNNGGNGGNLNLSSGAGGTHQGTGTDGTAGIVNIQTAGTTRLSVSATNVTIPAFSSSGVVLNDASGNLSSGQIVNSNVSSSAAIAVSKLAIGTADQLLDTNHGATTAEWFTLGGDATFASHNLTVTGLQGNALPSPTGTNTFLKWTGSAFNWSSAGSVTWANDLAGSTSNNQYVAAISGNNNSGGTIPINATTLQFYSIINPNINQQAYASTSIGSGANGQILTITSQAGQNVTGASNNGGNGGNLVLVAGTGGTSGSATGGTGGDIQVSSGPGSGGSASGSVSLQLGSTELIKLDAATIGNVTFTNTTAVPKLSQTAQSSTSSASGANGSNFTIASQAGQAATGASHNGGNGGNVVLTPGAGGTSGSATTGAAGTIQLNGSQNVVVSSGKTANYTVVKGDYVILIGTITSSITITLPASPSTGDTYVVKTGKSCYQFVRNDAGTLTTVGQTVTVSPSSGNIDGQSSYIMAQPYQSLTCVYTGSEWSII